MPKSKRNKQVELSKARKHGMEGKKKLYEEIRSCVDSYANIFIFSVNDMRNSKIKSVRDKWRHSRFFIGKNKVMALALGRTPEEEYRTNLHKIGERLRGEKGLLFSNQSPEEVLKWFSSYSEGDYARSGNRATETVELQEGPLSQFPHNLEPYLRQLGLPTTLVKGVIHLRQDHTVCKEGDILTPETAKILKLLGYEMAEFYIKIQCVWSQDGSFKNLQSDNELAKDANHKQLSDNELAEDSDQMQQSENEIEDTENMQQSDNELAEDTENMQPPDNELAEDTDHNQQSPKVSPQKNIQSLTSPKTDNKINNASAEDTDSKQHSTEESPHKNDESSAPAETNNKINNGLAEDTSHGQDSTDVSLHKNVESTPVRTENKINNGSAENTDAEQQSTEVSPQKKVQSKTSKKNHKRHSTGESPIERQLRNRTVKIVKNKK